MSTSVESQNTAPELTPAALAAVMAHPAFDAAMLSGAADAVAHYVANPRMRRYSRDRGSYLVSLAALYLHATPEGLTATRLTSLCVERQICSAGRVAALLAYMRGRGDLAAMPHDSDRRVRTLLPGPDFLAFQRSRFRVEFKALSLLIPGGGVMLAAFDAGDMFARFLNISAPTLLAGFGRAEDPHSKVLNVFAERDTGLLMLFKLVENGAFFTGEPFRISVLAVAGALGVSRIHILTLLAEADTAELMIWQRDTHELIVSAKLRDAVRHHYGVMFLFLGFHLASMVKEG